MCNYRKVRISLSLQRECGFRGVSEIQRKISQNCCAIFLSPVFNVEKSKKFLGLYKFNYLSRMNKINILALGGISENNIRKLKLLYIKGFGGIRIFKKKPAFKKGRFL